jgi:hypothetical protein
MVLMCVGVPVLIVGIVKWVKYSKKLKEISQARGLFGSRAIGGDGEIDASIIHGTTKGDVTAYGKGGSNGENHTTNNKYWGGVKLWNAGTVIGITNMGKRIGGHS